MTVPKMLHEVLPSGCHEWARARNSRGYGVVWFEGKVHLAHRVAWFLARGTWPAEGMVLDHICNNKACVNAAHLRELENWQNLRRAHPCGDAETERVRARRRAAQARHRGTYSATYTPERGE